MDLDPEQLATIGDLQNSTIGSQKEKDKAKLVSSKKLIALPFTPPLNDRGYAFMVRLLGLDHG